MALDQKKVLTHIIQDKGTIIVQGTVNVLPKTITNSNIRSEHVCVYEVLSNPSAQTADWAITTSNGSLVIDVNSDSPTTAEREAALNGSTDITIYLNPTSTGGMSGTTIINVPSFSSLPATVSDSNITSNHTCVRSTLSNPSAQTADWAVTTTNGSVTIDVNLDNPTTADREAAINGSTTAELYLTTSTLNISKYVPRAEADMDYHGSWDLDIAESLRIKKTVYKSNSSYNVADAWDTAKIKFSGYTSFSIYIRSYAETNSDYVLVSQLNNDYLANCTSTLSMRSVYTDSTCTRAYTRGKQSSSSYEEVVFFDLDPSQEYYFYVIYQKDGSINSNDDSGYFYVDVPLGY